MNTNKVVRQKSAWNAFRNELLLQRLEGRVLFDGVANLQLDVQLAEESPSVDSAEMQFQEMVVIDHSKEGSLHHLTELLAVETVQVEATNSAREIPTEIVVLDSSIENYAELLEELTQRLSLDRNLEVLLIESDEDGLLKLSTYLEGRTGIEALHLISHGADGTFRLGNHWLTAESIASMPDQFTGWKESLSDDADILIYGCNVAQSESGELLVARLSQLTGADVASSTDPTGATTLNGDWQLEYLSGKIESLALAPINADGQWLGLLAAPTVTSVSSSIFYMDSGDGLTSRYVGYRITNPGPTAISDAYVTIGTFGGGFVGLATFEDGVVHVGSLASGQSKVAYFYLTSSFTGGTSTVDQTHVVKVLEGPPALNNVLASQTITLTDVDNTVISASSNKVNTVVTTSNPATVGSLMTITVTGETGTIGSQKVLSFTPASYGNWRADAFEMIGSEVTLSGGNTGTFSDQLHFTVNSTSNTHYTAVYTFRLTNTTTTATAVSPVGYISSGAQIKHTSTGNYATFAPIENPVNTTTLSIAVDDNSLTGAGVVTYTITLNNSGNAVVTMNQILATLPAGVSIVSGSATHNGTSIGNPIVNGQQLSWNGSFSVAGRSTSTLTFQANIPSTPATYITTAYAITGNLAIDTTTVGSSSTPDAPASVAVVVSAPSPPDAVNDSFSVTEDTTRTGNVLANDTDPNLDPLTVTSFSVDTDSNGSQESFSPGQTATIVGIGTLTVSSSGNFTFIPVQNYTGSVPVITYTISDGSGGADSATLTLGTISAVNDPPSSTNDSATTPEDAPLVLAISDFGTFSDVDGDSLSAVRISTLPTVGTLQYYDWATSIWGGVTLNQVISAVDIASGRLRFSPAENEYGSPYATIGFEVRDATLFAPAKVLTIHVTPENDPPSAIDDSFTTQKNVSTTIDARFNDSDIEGAALTITRVNGVEIVAGGPAVAVTNGTVTLNAAGTLFTFNPSPDYVGAISFSYEISDGQGGTSTADVIGEVTPTNQAPVATDDNFTTNEEVSVSISVKSNDTDADGNSLSITHVNGASIVAGGASVAVTNGSVSLNAAGTLLTFTPSENYNGPVSFTYTINDGAGESSTATVNGTVLAVNDPPLANNDSFTVDEDDTVTILALANDTDVDGNPLTITLVNGSAIIAGGAAVSVANGTVTLNADGTQLTFSPSANYNGPASFTYSISDGQGGSSTATISGTVTPVNDVPVAGNDSFSTSEDTAVAILVNANDSDVDGNPLTVTHVNGQAIVAAGSPVAVTNGTVTLNAAGTELSFNPAENYNGPASFTYTISDGAGGTATATVSGSVGGSNDAPVAFADANSTSENSTAGGNVLTNDSDLDGEMLMVTAVNGSPASVGATVPGTNGGSFTILAIGSYTFNPGTAFDNLATGQTRTTTITYQVSDGNGGTATSNVSIKVTGTNDSPVSTTIAAQNDSDGQIISRDFSGSFSDVDNGDSLAYSASNLPPGLSIHPSTGVISGTLASNASQSGPYSVTITATDILGATTEQKFTWNLSNPAPTANGDTGSTTENASVSGNVKTNDSDPDGDTLFVSSVNGQPGNVGNSVIGTNGGSFTIQANGTYVFDPGTAFDDLAVGQTRTTSVSYAISDGQGGFDTTIVTMTITGTNDTPTSTAIATQNHTDGAAVVLDISDKFSDLDTGTALEFSANNLPTGLSINASTGVISGTISSSASVGGPYSVTVTASDSSGASTSQTFTWNVQNPAPTASNDSRTTAENSPTTGSVLSNDSDSDGDTLTVTAVSGLPGGVGIAVSGSNGGQFTIDSTGAYTFVPGTSFDDLAVGEARVTTVTYSISDGQGGSATATLSVTVTGANDVPKSTSIPSQSSNDGDAVTLNVRGSFNDVDGSDSLTFNASNLPTGLSVNAATGIISGTLAVNASVNGPYSVTIMAVDSQGTTTSQTFTWSASNIAPNALSDSGASSQTGSASGNVLSNDVDPDGDILKVSQVNGDPANVGVGVAGSNGGTFSINANGGYSFSPGAAFNDLALEETRTTSVTYTATDLQGGTSTTTLTVTVTGTNDAPSSASLATQSSSDNQVVSINVSGKFGDSDNGDSLTFSANNLPPGLSIDANTGLISGTIDHSASVGGPYSVTITATDIHGATTSQSFTWNVANPAPSAVANSGTTSENNTTTGNVLSNDNDPDGDTITVSNVDGLASNVGVNVTGSNGGTFTISANGDYVFNPGTSFDNLALGETRTTSISYRISDGEGGSSTTTLSIAVTGSNDGPVSTAILNQSFVDSEAVNLDISGNFNDPDSSDTLVFNSSNLPPGLTMNSATGVISGTIDPSASSGGPYSVTITATDPHGQVTSQTFSWVVTNVPPTAYDDFDGTNENSLVTGNVLTNDVDPDGDLLQVTQVNGQPERVGISAAGSHGGFFTIHADGSYTFIPGADFDNLAVGETRSTAIFYTADDSNGGAVQAMLTVVVTGVNDAPTSTPIPTQISNDGAAVSFNAASNFSDADSSNVLTFSASGLPAGLSINSSTGVIQGTIAANASLSDPYSVTVTGTDPQGAATSQTFTWNVINPGPSAVADTRTGDENTIIGGNVLTNDSDADGDALSVSAVGGVAGNVGAGVTGSSGGTFTIQSNGSFSFNPGTAFDDLAVGETRTTSVSYTISDGQGGTSSATVTIIVTGLNDAPNSAAIATQYGIDNTPITLDVSSNFSDVDSTDNLTFSASGTLPLGLSINSITGIISGTIDASASLGGPHSVTITATDPHGASTSQPFTWNISNPAPTASSDSATVATGVIGSGNVLTNDTDPDGDSLSVNAVNGVAGNVGIAVVGSNGGSFAINRNGAYTFDAGADFADLAEGETRTTAIGYTMTDGQGGLSTATVTITVVGGNEAPTSTPIATQSNTDNAPVVLDVSSHFVDPDSSDVLTFSANNLPTGLSIHPNTGVVTGTIDRAASQSGPYTVTITATDPWGAITSQSFTWNISNPAPVAANDNLSTGENSTSTGNVLTQGNGDIDPDGDILKVVQVNGQTTNVGAAIAGSAGGVFVIHATGAMSFNPGADFNDLAVGEIRTTSVTYTISDGQGGTSSAIVTYAVIGANDAPVSSSVVNQVGNDADVVMLDLSSNFSDADSSDGLIFNDNGSLPPGLSIDSQTGVISGTIHPAASVTEPYTVTITAIDPHGGQSSQTFTWDVNNLAPTALTDSASVTEENSIGGNLLSNDNDPDGDTLTVSRVNGTNGLVGSSLSGSQGGTFVIAPNGAWAFNPGSAFNGLAQGETRSTTVTYTITDQQGGSDTAQLTVTVTGTNDLPVSSPIAARTSADSAQVSFSIAGSFSDPDSSDTLTFSAGATLPPGLSLDPNSGIISGMIDSSASAGGPYTVAITATDPWGGQSTQKFVWTISNPAPVTLGESATTGETNPVNGNVLTNDSDPDGDLLSVSAVGGVSANVGSVVSGTNGGTFKIQSNGDYKFTPGSDFIELGPGQTRTTSISYTVSDADGATSLAAIVITVTGNNDAPVVTSPIATQDSTGLDVVSFNVSSHLSDADITDVLTYSTINLPPGLSIDPATGLISGTISATASADGPYSVTVTATDPQGAAVSTVFTWNVVNPDLVVTVDDAVASAQPGETVVFTINYSNVNDRPATNVVLTQTLPTNTTFNVASSSPGWIDNGNGTCSLHLNTLGGLANGSVLFVVTVDSTFQAGLHELVTHSTIADDGAHGQDLTPTNNVESESTPLNAAPDVAVSIVPQTISLTPGQTSSYLINYQNSGNQGATGVIVTMTLPPNATFNSSTSTIGWMHQGNGIYTFDLGNLPAGAQGALVWAFDLPPSMPAGVESIMMTASISDDGSNGPDNTPSDKEAKLTIPVDAAPDYRIELTDNRTLAYRGEQLTYSIRVANQGNQDGTGVTVVSHYPSDVLELASVSHNGIVDPVAGTITWYLGNMAGDGEEIELTIQAHISVVADESITNFSVVAAVFDDVQNGVDATNDNKATDSDGLQSFKYDSFHNRSKDQFGLQPIQIPALRTRLQPLSVEPIFSGLSDPGATLVGRIYDQHGSLIGERQVMADSSGNWIMTFPNSYVMEHPYRMEIAQTASIQSDDDESGFNFRRYFHPVAHSNIVFTSELSINEVLRRSAYEMVEETHESNTAPFGLSWNSAACPLATASTNIGQG